MFNYQLEFFFLEGGGGVGEGRRDDGLEFIS